MDIRPASRVDESALRAFYAGAYPARAAFLGEHWRWLYRVGRFPGIEPLVLVEGGRVLGHAGAIPAVISRHGREAPAMWFTDFFVAPELQGKGHGRALTEAWMAMCPDRVSFCNDLSIRVFRKQGWKDRDDASVRTQPLELSGPLRRRLGPLGAAAGLALNAPWRAWQRARVANAPALELAPLPGADRLAALLDDPALSGARVVRDEDWCRWRLLDHPRRDEHRLASCGGVAAVLRLFTSLGRRRAHLLHVGPGSAAARAGLVKAFARWALDEGADDAWLVAGAPDLAAAGALYFKRAHTAHFAWSSSDAAVEKALGETRAQGLDSDHDLMFP